MDVFVKDLNSVLYDLLNPAVISVLATLGSSTIPILRYVAKKNKEQKAYNDLCMKRYMQEVQGEVKSVKMMLLRHEILDAVRNDSLSVEDVMSLYDQYKAVGGNSFITEEVHSYIKRKRSKVNVKHNH